MHGTSAAGQPGKPGGAAQPASAQSDDFDCIPATIGSPYIPVDSWIYPAVWRLYGLGYVDTFYLNMRPWTRASLGHMLDGVADRLKSTHSSGDEEGAESDIQMPVVPATGELLALAYV